MSGDSHTGADVDCATIMRSQFGVIHERQAIAAGMTRRMIRYRVRSGRWDALHPVVFRLAGTPTSREQRVMAAVLYGGPGAVAFGRCAAAMWDLAGGRWDPPEIASSRQLLRAGSPVIARRCATPRIPRYLSAGCHPRDRLDPDGDRPMCQNGCRDGRGCSRSGAEEGGIARRDKAPDLRAQEPAAAETGLASRIPR